jgi:alkanesulfonate monooxygenase
MSIEFIWQLPTSGDGRHGNAERERRGERSSAAHPYSPGVTDPRGRSFNYFDHLHQVARAADLAGFDGLRIPEDPAGDEPWIVAGYVARGTRHLKLLTEFEASRGSSVYAAKNAVSYQRFTGGRFAWQIKAGGDEKQRRAQGDFVADGDRHARIEEFLTVARGVLTQSPYSFKGRFFEVQNGGFQGALGNQSVPLVYLSGNSPEDYGLSAKVADVHVFDAASTAELEKKVALVRELAKTEGRQLGFGLRLDVLARETEEEAIFDAERYWQQPGGRQSGGAPTVDQRLWAGLTSNNTGAAATLVGSYEQVVQALIAYFAAGIDSFLLSAVPSFEEAYRLGEHVLPLVRSQVSPEQRRAVGGLA